MSNEELWWDAKRTLSYNCLFNFVIGMRGGGKTYGSLKYAVEQYIKSGQQFMYIRRYQTELDKLTKQRGGRLFNAVKSEFPSHELKAESNTLYIRKKGSKDYKVLGYAQPLTTASVLKSDAFPDVTLLVFDEFIIDTRGAYHYLKDEVTKFLDLYETIARGRDVKCLFLSNAVSITNPYFDFFHLNKPYNGDIQRFGQSKEILVQNFLSTALQNKKKTSRFGSIISGTEYSNYAYDNEWLLDNEDFIEKKNKRCWCYVILTYKGHNLGIWCDPVQWIYYVSEDCDMQIENRYSVTTDDHKPNVMLFKTGRKLPWLKRLIDSYECGAVRYESMKLKNWFRDIMRMANHG